MPTLRDDEIQTIHSGAGKASLQHDTDGTDGDTDGTDGDTDGTDGDTDGTDGDSDGTDSA